MPHLGDAIRHLMETREVTGLQLAADVGITPASVSRILNDQSRPRQVTLTRIMKRLCRSRDDEQLILKAYSGLLEALPVEGITADNINQQEEIARCERFMEIKTQSIAFKKSVGRELVKAGIEAQQDFCEGLVSTDYLIEKRGKRLAIECKFNYLRDLEKTKTLCSIIREKLHCEHVLVVVPFIQEESSTNWATPSSTLVSVADLPVELKTWINVKG